MTRWLSGLVAAGLVTLAVPAVAHHAVQSEFDMNGKPQTWTGTLKEVRWVNPHTHFVLEVGDAGKPALWVFETAAPNGLRRAGFSQKGRLQGRRAVHLRRLPGARRIADGVPRVVDGARR
jgi:hypothetical protein